MNYHEMEYGTLYFSAEKRDLLGKQGVMEMC